MFKGYLCLPYLSLPYLDLLADINVRGYIVGATNVLFKQKKQLIDVLVEVNFKWSILFRKKNIVLVTICFIKTC